MQYRHGREAEVASRMGDCRDWRFHCFGLELQWGVDEMKKTTPLLTVIAGLCVGLPGMFAQVETARITGTVSDATGAVVPAVNVIVTHL